MRAINTMPKEEYAERLSEDMRRMSKKISRMSDEEESLMSQFDNNGDEEKALRHYFNSQALSWAMYALAMSPDMIKRHMDMIKNEG